MHKTILNSTGSRIGIYYPITGKIELGHKTMKMDKLTFKSYCEENGWSLMK